MNHVVLKGQLHDWDREYLILQLKDLLIRVNWYTLSNEDPLAIGTELIVLGSLCSTRHTDGRIDVWIEASDVAPAL